MRMLLSLVGCLLILLPRNGLATALQSSDSLRLQAFYQGAAGNCVSIALIKAAIDHYGLYEVFDTIRTDTGVQVTLRDKTILSLTADERKLAALAANFIRNDNALPEAEKTAIIQYANLCYAIIAKYIQTKGEWGCLNNENETDPPQTVKSFVSALKTMDNGICADNCYRHLGLAVENPTEVEYTIPIDFRAKKGVMVYSDKHAVFVLRNKVDYHGDWIPVGKRTKCSTSSFKAKYYLILL